MGLYAKTVLFARRLSVFYLLVGIFSIFFGIFYYKYLPANEAELDTRGFRILDQLTSNMVRKDATLADAFGNAVCNNCSATTETDVLHQIYAHIRFDTVPASRVPKTGGIQNTPHYGWSLVYNIGMPDTPATHPSTARNSPTHPTAAVIRMSDFMEPILAARTDLFDSYILLTRDTATRAPLKLIYIQGSLSSSYGFNADSAFGLQKNSDLSDITTVSIGNESYNLFFQPFQFQGTKLMLGGLIRKADYDRDIKTLPPNFVVGMILIILIGLVVLPFIKVFFISPKETINKWDVLRITASLYLGTAILILTGVYFLADFSAHNVVEEHLYNISDSLECDIRHDLDAAGQQLQKYIDDYNRLGPLTSVVAYKDTLAEDQEKTDSIFLPTEYPLVARVIWFDSLGNTLAKWNPFTFISPPSSVLGYSFFTQLQAKDPDDTSLVLSAGQSNITSEFQMFLARRLQQPIDTSGPPKPGPKTRQSFGLLVPFYLHSGLHPVLPRGYGFCLVDNQTMNVLMHSDSRRNLSENLYLETGGNQRLKNVIDHKMKTSIDGVDLYGSSHTFYCRPVHDRNVSLVVFYDDSTHSENIFRMIHFGAETLLYMALLFVACLLLSTAGINGPNKLSFSLNSIEWIRPRLRNARSYNCTRRYFRDLVWISFALYLCMAFTKLDIRIVFYTNLLLPFYSLWGFVASRKKEDPRFPTEAPAPRLPWYTEIFLSSKTVVATLFLFNLLIFRLHAKWEMDQGPDILIALILFQLLALAALFFRYHQSFYSDEDFPGNIHFRNYIQSLYRSVMVMTIIPALGFLWYGWSVEKIQYLRSDQLSVMEQNEAHLQHSSRLLHQLRPDVLAGLDKSLGFGDSLLYHDSRYLSSQKIVESEFPDPANASASHTHAAAGSQTQPLSRNPDQPYIVFLDQLFVITAGEYNSYSIAPRAADSSWYTTAHLPEKIVLTHKTFDIISPLQGSLFSLQGAGLFHGMMLIIAIILFLVGLPRLLKGTAHRLFLLNLVSKTTTEDRTLLKNHFPPDGKFPKPEFIVNEITRARLPLDRQEEYILQTMLENRETFQKIWDELSTSEKYFIYAFAADGYANYRDFKLIYVLSKKGLLRSHESKWNLFAASFREFVLQKKGTREITNLKDRFSVPGLWSTIRIPALIVIIACAILLLLTQESVSHKITVMATSAGAIVPIILEITKKFTGKGSG